jgi:hypothetical protein
MKTKYVIFLITLCVLCACSSPTQSTSYTLPDPAPYKQTTLEVRTSTGLALRLVSASDGATTRTTLSATPDYAPAWLSANGGTVTIQTIGEQSAMVTGDCLQTATEIPAVSAGGIVGPQPGYTAVTDGTTESRDGGTLWQGYSGTAEVRAGHLVALDAQGVGRILLPDNTTRTDAFSWSYRRIAWPDPVPRITATCTLTTLTTFTLPEAVTARRLYGGALLAEHADNPAAVGVAFLPILRAEGWRIDTISHTPALIVWHVARGDLGYQVVLSATATGTTDITVYKSEP